VNCNKYENKILDYFDNNLSETEHSAFEEHLKNCNSCKQKITFFRSTLSVINEEKQQKVNPHVTTRILAKISQSNNKIVTIRKIAQPILIAAMMILVVWFGNQLAEAYINTEIQASYKQDTSQIDQSVQYVINDISYADYYFLNSQ